MVKTNVPASQTQSGDITRSQVLRYAFTPQILPRVKNLIGSGFPNLSYLIAVVFNTLRILPNNHPYLRSDHHGKYSVTQAIAAAASHISFGRKNIDKIAIFTLVLSGIVMLVLQFILWIAALVAAAPAYAASAGPGLGPRTLPDFFDNGTPATDLAFRLLDLVFGIQGVFNSSDMGTQPFHAGMHALYEFYSYGILLIGCLVIIYLAIAIVMETAQSGIPFGKRFNKPWVPVRLILFFGLLLPTGSGINLAQYLVLNAAKYGSNLSTNAWITFHEATNSPYLGEPESLVAVPNLPDLNNFAGFMALARTCSWAEGRNVGETRDIRPYFVFGPGKEGAIDMSGSTPAFATMVKNAAGGALYFRFGVQDEKLYPDEKGAVMPYCGELFLTVTDQGQPGAALIQQAYVEMIGCMWDKRSGSAIDCSQDTFDDMGRDYTSKYSVILPYNPYPDMDPYEGQNKKISIIMSLNKDFQTMLEKAAETQASGGDWANTTAATYGWAGASIWFNKIAEMNGALTSATFNKPQIKTLPQVMEYIRSQKLSHDKNTPLEDLYSPYLSEGRLIDFETPQQLHIARVVNQLYQSWSSERATAFIRELPETHQSGSTGNVIIDTMNLMLGTRGLFDICKNTNVHPMAQLSSLGRAMIEHSIRSFAVAAGFGIVGGIAGILNQNIGSALQSASSFFITFASIGLLVGFILFYVLPFLPFIYFFFALTTWIKSIFEAMVGMPLWALAHLKIDGDGMPGDSAATGYFHLLEIFLRPIAILIGFLGGIIIFGASVKVLNSIFYLVISNLSGHDVAVGTTDCFQPPAGPNVTATTIHDEALYKRGVIDEFFFTVIYTIMVFMLAMPCFKLVDLIPDYIQRWLGSGVKPFGAQDGDPAEGLVRNVSVGAGTLGAKFQGMGSALGFRM